MAGRREPSSEADGNEAEAAGDSTSQADELHVQVSDLRRLHTESATFAPLPWRRQHVQLPRPLVDFSAGETVAGAGGPDVWFIARSAKPGYVQLPQINYTVLGGPSRCRCSPGMGLARPSLSPGTT